MADTTFFGILVMLLGAVGVLWPKIYFKIHYLALRDAEMSDIGGALYRVIGLGIIFAGFILFLNN